MSSWPKRVIAGWKGVESAITGGPCSDITIEGVIDREFGSTVVPEESTSVSAGLECLLTCLLHQSW
jgi:hypothetical protein